MLPSIHAYPPHHSLPRTYSPAAHQSSPQPKPWSLSSSCCLHFIQSAQSSNLNPTVGSTCSLLPPPGRRASRASGARAFRARRPEAQWHNQSGLSLFVCVAGLHLACGTNYIYSSPSSGPRGCEGREPAHLLHHDGEDVEDARGELRRAGEEAGGSVREIKRGRERAKHSRAPFAPPVRR